MENILNRKIVLQLNANWQPIGKKTVKDAFISMTGGSELNPPALALDIQYEMVDGKPDFSKLIGMSPITWDKWMELPIRSYDEVIHTAKLTLRVPTVIVAMNFNKMPSRVEKLTSSAIWKRDKGICQYTGKKLSKSEGNIDHIVPKARGGKDTWSNVVVACKEINSKKGHKMNHEIGLKLLKEPKEPLPSPCFVLDEIAHKDWELFIVK